MGARIDRQVDLHGTRYGAHVDGPEVCERFQVQTRPKAGVWGWNDTGFFYCTNCGKHADEHVVLEKPKYDVPGERKPPPQPRAP